MVQFVSNWAHVQIGLSLVFIVGLSLFSAMEVLIPLEDKKHFLHATMEVTWLPKFPPSFKS
jgi:hypothetical protein